MSGGKYGTNKKRNDQNDSLREESELLLSDVPQPAEALQDLQKEVESLWRGDYDYTVVKNISAKLREIEGRLYFFFL